MSGIEARLRKVAGHFVTMVDIQEQDNWISYLSECKQLSENDIKRLCETVSYTHLRAHET